MISVCILTKNSQRYLRDVLIATSSFKDVVILDTGSEDASLDIASEFKNVTIHKGLFTSFGKLHNQISSLAKYDWILSLDSDEILSQELVEEILSLHLDPKNVYSFPFHNYYNKKWITSCGWYPDRHIRLYHKKSTCFSENLIHEGVVVKDHQIIKLKKPVNHYSYHSLDDFLRKMHLYARLFSQQNVGKRKSSPFIALIHGLVAFFKSYVIKRGCLQGYEGFAISSYQGISCFYKYLMLYEANQALYPKDSL